MRCLTVFSLLLSLSFQLQATTFEEMFIAESSMKVESAHGYFEGLETVKVTLLALDGQTVSHIMLNYDGTNMGLSVYQITNEDGATHYYADLAGINPSNNPMATRFLVSIIETTAQDGVKEKTWSASVRAGLGPLETLGSTMTLSGTVMYFNK